MTGHKKKLENVTQGQRKNQSKATDPEMRSMVKLADDDFKTADVNIFKYSEENMNISKSIIEDMKRNQMEIIEMKIEISEIKNSLKGISSRLYTIEEKMGEPENITIETIQTKAMTGKKTEKYEETQ